MIYFGKFRENTVFEYLLEFYFFKNLQETYALAEIGKQILEVFRAHLLHFQFHSKLKQTFVFYRKCIKSLTINRIA